MPEPIVTDVTPPVEEISPEVTAKEEDAGFAEGFSGEPAKPTEEIPPAEPVVEPVVEPVDEPPKFAQLTESQFSELMAKASAADIEKLRGDFFGKVGGIERILKELQTATPAGQTIAVTEEDFAELKEEFPDVTEKLLKGMVRAFSKIKGTGLATLTPEQIAQQVTERATPLVNDAVAKIKTELTEKSAVERLTDRHRDWSKTVGPTDSQTDFRKWLKTKEPTYEAKVLGSWDPIEIGDALDTFKEFQKKQVKPTPPKGGGSNRTQRLEEAIPPKGGSSPTGPREQTVDEAFAVGFKTGRT